jgi:hypothetical protein
VLLKYGADINAESQSGRNVVLTAAVAKKWEVSGLI